MSTLLRTSSLEISESAGVVTVSPRIGPTMAFAGAGAVLGGLTIGLSHIAALPGAVPELLAWAGWVVAGCCLLLLVVVPAQAGRGRSTIDGPRRVARVGGLELPVDRMGAPRIERTTFGGAQLLALVVEVDGRPLPLVRGVQARDQAQFDAAVAAIRVALAGAGGAAPLADAAVATVLPFGALTLSGLGLVWMASARLLAPDVVLTPPNTPVGVALWGVGGAPLLLGGIELVVRKLGGDDRWERVRLPVTGAVFVLVFVVFFRRVG